MTALRVIFDDSLKLFPPSPSMEDLAVMPNEFDQLEKIKKELLCRDVVNI